MNQKPEQPARNLIDAMLIAPGRIVQSKKNLNLNATQGVAVREYQTDIGCADDLFVDKKPVNSLVYFCPYAGAT